MKKLDELAQAYWDEHKHHIAASSFNWSSHITTYKAGYEQRASEYAWVSVDDGTPDVNRDFLMHRENGTCETDYFGDKEHMLSYFTFDDNNVTHWKYIEGPEENKPLGGEGE